MRRQGEIDWDLCRAQLAASLAAAEGHLTLSPTQAKALMDQRARRFAEALDGSPIPAGLLPSERAKGAGPDAADAPFATHVVTFTLAEERYAIELRYLLEVARLVEIAPVPGTPDFLVGLVAHRGEILAVIDLRKLLGIEVKGLSDSARILVLGGENAELGVLADAVGEVISIRKDAILEAPGLLISAGRGYVVGVTRDALIVLSGASLLGDAQLFERGEAKAAGLPAGEVEHVDR